MTSFTDNTEQAELQPTKTESVRRQARLGRSKGSSVMIKSTMKPKRLLLRTTNKPAGSNLLGALNNGLEECPGMGAVGCAFEAPTGCLRASHQTDRRQAGNNLKRIRAHYQGRLEWQLMVLALIGALIGISLAFGPILGEARVTFEKMTNRDYSGSTYYTIQNVSLFECLGWCKEESSCTSSVFSFVVNPFAALQETTCMLQNDTAARSVPYLKQTPIGDQLVNLAHPQKATNLYFFNKIELQTESVCTRLWAFERFPNRKLRARDRQAFHAASKEACQAACTSDSRSVCRSLEYNYISQLCTLNSYDRRSPNILHLAQQASIAAQAAAQVTGQPGHHASPNNNDLVEAPGTDYFENACLLSEDICHESRIYDHARIGLPQQRTAHFVELNYYPDKEMLVKSQAGCVRACSIENEFICRSILYRSSFKQGQPNCALYHLDQKTFPDGADNFMSYVMQPLLDSGETSAVYLEAVCNDTVGPIASSTTITLPPPNITIMPSSTTPGGLSVHATGGHHLGHQNGGNHHQGGYNQSNEERFISSSSTLSPLGATLSTSASSTTIRLPTTFLPPSSSSGGFGSGGSSSLPMGGQQIQVPSNIQIPDPLSGSPSSSGRPTTAHFTLNQPRLPAPPSHITITPMQPSRDSNLIIEPSGPASISAAGSGPTNHDQNCDAHGFCYDVALKCTDTKMVVNVKTQRPFFGRIYALGRSETCNANIKNQNQFQLDMYLTGQECNTQSAHHNVVLTKADKVYHVRCTYETASRNVSFGMMPVKDMFEVDVDDRNRETISITASSDAPLPKISILTSDGKEASTVRIGDRLTFRIEIPDNTPYGIFARSCIAMAKDARSTFEIIDDNGCPVDHTIFPNFLPISNGNALESNYEAFRFTESYGVIFQCNVKYCIGKCEPVTCGIGGRDPVDAWGRKKRSVASGKQLGDDMTLSREIVVLDLKEKDPGATGSDSDQTSEPAEGLAHKQKLALRSQGNANSQVDGTSNGDFSSGSTNSHQSTSSTSLDGSTKHCVSSQNLFVLICSIGLFFVLYVCIVAYFFARRDPKISPIKHQYH